MTIVYILAALIVGWVIGFLDSNLRTSKKIEAAEAKAELAVSEAEQKIAEARAQVRAEPPAVVDDPGLLRLRNVEGNHQLEVDGERVDVKAVSAGHRKRLIELLTVIRPWLDVGGQPSPAPGPAVETRAQPTPPFIQKSPPSILTTASVVPQVDPMIYKSMSIVAQIDTILQAHLAGTLLVDKAIRLVEGELGGVAVYVGLDKYSTIDDVPDPKIKAMIRAAVSEWEAKLTPRE